MSGIGLWTSSPLPQGRVGSEGKLVSSLEPAKMHFLYFSLCMFPRRGKRVRSFYTPRSLNRETPNLFTVGSSVINVGLSLSLHFRLEREADLFPPLMGLRRQKPGRRQGWWHKPRDGANSQARAVESA